MSMAPFADPELVGGGHVPHTAEELCPVCWGPLAELLASASDSVLAQERASIKPRHWGLAARRERVPSSPHLPDSSSGARRAQDVQQQATPPPQAQLFPHKLADSHLRTL